MQNAKEINRVRIFKGHEEVGLLTRTQNGYELSFLPEWYSRSITYTLKGAPVVIRREGESLPAFFANLLPEGYRLRALRESVKTSEDDLFSLLVASGHSFIGDIQIESGLKIEPRELVSPQKINFYDFFVRHAGEEMPESISGVQEKISSSMISFPVNVAQNTHQYILKLNPRDRPHLVENEFACMTLAKKCKLSVAQIRLVKDQDQNQALLVQRFDRQWSEASGAMVMIHQEDACQFMNLYPAQKYRVSWNQLTESVSELTQGSLVELLGLLRLYAFSYLIGNGDLHAKNVSLIDLPNRPRTLTPAYDLICTRIYGDDRMALKLDGNDQNLTRPMMIQFGMRYGVPQKATELLLDRLVQLFIKNQKLLFTIPMTEKQLKMIEEMTRHRIKNLMA